MKTVLRNLVSELRADILSAKAVPALSAGFISGLGLLVAEVAFGLFIFSGSLAPYASQGVGLVLFGNFAVCLVIALASSYRGAIAGLATTPVVVMAEIGATVDAEGDARFVTTVGALMISAMATGVCCLMIGRFRLVNMVRFIPYPVAGGFVAGIGGAVCLAAMSVMGAEPDWRAMQTLLEPTVLWTWGPGAGYGVALYLSMKRWGNPLILPVSVALAVGAYHLGLATVGMSGDEARTAGLLLTSTANGSLWPALGPADLVQVEWTEMAKQVPNMVILMLVAIISIIMNFAGLEVVANQELDWEREFKASGVATVLAGLGGGTVGTMIVPSSLRSKLFGATTRLTGVVAALVIGSALVLGDGALELVPTALVGGILVFAGLGMMDEGLVRSSKRLPGLEYGIILLIFVTIMVFGLFEGVGAGMLATLVFFAVRLSRVDLIEAQFTARERRSNKVRPVTEQTILLEEGERVRVYRLQGYIFFGSISPLIAQLRQSLKGPSHPACLILDFGSVSGFDVSAVNVLSRFLQTMNAAGVQVVLSAVSEPLKTGLERNLPPAVFAGLLVEPNTDHALERGEDLVIAEWKTEAAKADQRRAALLETVAEDLDRHLDRQIQFEDLMEELQDWLTPRQYAAGETLAGPGTPQEGLQLLVSGRVSAYDAAGTRLYQCGPGDAIWPTGSTDYTKTVMVADESCRAMELTPAARRKLETHEERLAFRLYRYLLAGRLQAGS